MEELENKESVEQPTSIKECNPELDNNVVENVAPVEEDGSIPKFKNIKALENAYANLEKEFTKKCQKISELEKHNVDNAQAPTKTVTEDEFFTNAPFAQKFREEIAQTASNNGISLEQAYAKILERKIQNGDELLQDENFVDSFVMKNSSIKQKIIGEYLTNIMSNKQIPFITENTGSHINLLPKLKPSSIKEAGEIVQAMFDV